MTEKIAVELGDVQKTLFLPLWGRAMESAKSKPLLVDRTAQAILEKVDIDFTALGSRLSPLTQTAWIMRSIFVDEIVCAFLAKDPRATIVNIGCGLDTTFERVDNGRVTWIDLDLPDVIELRRKFVQETERRRFVSASFLDEGWMDRLHPSGPILFVAAGIFYYFDEQQVRSFLVRLAERFHGSEVLFDACSPTGMRTANRAVIKNSGLDERSYLKWGLSSPQDLLGWDPRFRLIKVYNYFGERASALPLGLRLFGRLSDALKIQYMLHLAV